MATVLKYGLVFAALSIIGVSSSGHAHYTCQQRLGECTSTYDSSKHDLKALQNYRECLISIENICSKIESQEAWRNMFDTVEWSINSYNGHFDYDRPSGSPQLLACTLLVTSVIAAWAVGKYFLPASR